MFDHVTHYYHQEIEPLQCKNKKQNLHMTYCESLDHLIGLSDIYKSSAQPTDHNILNINSSHKQNLIYSFMLPKKNGTLIKLGMKNDKK